MGLWSAQSSGRSSKHSRPTYQNSLWNRDQSIFTLGKNWLYFDKTLTGENIKHELFLTETLGLHILLI